MERFWERASGPALARGDLLPDCLVPLIAPGFGDGHRHWWTKHQCHPPHSGPYVT